MKATKRQIRILHAILAKRGMMDVKQQIVSDSTAGRTDHSSEMLYNEATDLLTRLNKGSEIRLSADIEAGNRMRRRILSMCYTLGWTRIDQARVKQTVDLERLNSWCIKYSYMHKEMNAYSYQELPALVSQFEKFLKSELKQ